ncbi:hypothetical protein CJD36_010105 [Flavipsychrobacter stenotrophus]|uniref:Uncharacterized protein n=1 Tax=Flavipsychrobacter stenotrophus TaxID=2077091 RepID=A0A2S7SYW7_9BACT|nr:hypothetical protein [Flavipsychrobacter stenotrophus]PQJ12129.1 hypothetical protein CJD36_010105 [Flavipsychrobacter stenotrophus]
MKNAKHYFKKYPRVEVLYFTADDLAFTELTAATDHASELDDDFVIPITRKEAMAAIKDMMVDGWRTMSAEGEQY